MKKILVFKLGAIGDVLMTTPFLRELKLKEPASCVDYLVGNWSSAVLKNNPNINKLIEVEDSIFYKKQISKLLKLYSQLNSEQYDEIYLLHRNLFYYYYFYSLFPKKLHGFRTIQSCFLKEEFDESQHHLYNYSRLVKKDTKSTQMDFYLPKDHQLNPNILQKNNLQLDQSIIAINPGGGANPGETVTVRQWPQSSYVQFIKKINKSHPKIQLVLTGGPTDQDLCNEIMQEVQETNTINLTSKFGLMDFRKILDSIDVFITGDTGGMHMAAAANCKVLSLFGPTNPHEKAPIGSNNAWIWPKIECSPCYTGKFKGCQNPVCMDAISIDMVYDNCLNLLSLPKSMIESNDL
ncbi:MAG: glycosyltransferase family 9 protein [Candidatus Cloacimonetes bacterium]|nr:glycosyltransferase family 9 protein [Candidatus Cloacimonadota bacterium]